MPAPSLTKPIIPSIKTASDVRADQAKLLARAQAVDMSVRQCGALPQTTRAQWGVWYINLTDTVRKGPNGILFVGADSDQVDVLRAELAGWEQTLGSTCALALPPEPTEQVDPTLGAVVQLARYAMIGAVVVGGIYVVGKVVEILPHPLFGKDRT